MLLFRIQGVVMLSGYNFLKDYYRLGTLTKVNSLGFSYLTVMPIKLKE